MTGSIRFIVLEIKGARLSVWLKCARVTAAVDAEPMTAQSRNVERGEAARAFDFGACDRAVSLNGELHDGFTGTSRAMSSSRARARPEHEIVRTAEVGHIES